MQLGKLHIHWNCRCGKDAHFLKEAYKKIADLQRELIAPRNLTDAHDREVILNYLMSKTKDELEALSLGFDSRWMPMKNPK